MAIIDKTELELGYFLALKNGTAVLADGYYIENDKLMFIEPYGVKPIWNYENRVWEETASEEEIKEDYFNKINIFKEQILENGCWYVDSEGNKHRQKTRPEKDVPLLCSTIYKLETKIKKGIENPIENWAFEDGDIKQIDLDEALEINLKCGDYVSAIYKSEAILKAQEVNRELTFEKFTELVDSLSDTKTYKVEKTMKEKEEKGFGTW